MPSTASGPRLKWPPETIQGYIARAQSHGSVEVQLGSPREAHLFQFAVYNRLKKVGLKGLSTSLQGNIVLILTTPQPCLRLVEEEGPEPEPEPSV